MIKRIILILLTALFVNSSVIGQNKYNFQQFGKESEQYIKQPLKWNGKDFINLSVLLSVTYGLMHIDNDVKDYMKDHESWVGSIPMEFGRYWGEPIISSIAGLSFLLIGNNSSDERSKKTGFEILQASTYTGMTVGLIKITIGRSRPYTGADPFSFKPFTFCDDSWSIPSGHTAMAFSLSTVLANNTNSESLKVIAYLPAMLTAISRVNYNKHWVSDVFLGAAAGYFIAEFVDKQHRKNLSDGGLKLAQQPLFSASISF